jgi:hypothetical protein
MVSSESCSSPIDRALFAPRTRSLAELVTALCRDLSIRMQGRLSRGRVEARVRALRQPIAVELPSPPVVAVAAIAAVPYDGPY